MDARPTQWWPCSQPTPAMFSSKTCFLFTSVHKLRRADRWSVLPVGESRLNWVAQPVQIKYSSHTLQEQILYICYLHVADNATPSSIYVGNSIYIWLVFMCYNHILNIQYMAASQESIIYTWISSVLGQIAIWLISTHIQRNSIVLPYIFNNAMAVGSLDTDRKWMH